MSLIVGNNDKKVHATHKEALRHTNPQILLDSLVIAMGHDQCHVEILQVTSLVTQAQCHLS